MVFGIERQKRQTPETKAATTFTMDGWIIHAEDCSKVCLLQ